jgi:drug/metabolite transporter (DMT)-like permease
VIRQDLVPMVAGYLLVMAALAIGLRRLRRPRRGPAPQPSPARRTAGPLRWTRLIRHALSTAIAGYLLLGVVVVGYYYAVARVGGHFLQSAFTGTAVLLAIALPAFAAASWLTEGRRRRRRRPPGRPRAHRPAAGHLQRGAAHGSSPGRAKHRG